MDPVTMIIVPGFVGGVVIALLFFWLQRWNASTSLSRPFRSDVSTDVINMGQHLGCGHRRPRPGRHGRGRGARRAANWPDGVRGIILATSVAAGLLLSSVTASAQARGGSIGAFGGTTFGTTSAAPTFGGGVAVPLGDHVQLIGEAGRLTDIKASLLDDALDLTSIDIGMSAWYGEGGIRLIASRHSAVRPYVEATAGLARLKPSVGVDGWLGAVTNTGLGFLGSTEPLVGAGAGVILQGGPLSVDLGYRHKRILADGGLASAFALGNNGLDVNQVRVGFGVRF